MQNYNNRKNRKVGHGVSHAKLTWVFFASIACLVAIAVSVCLLFPLFSAPKKEQGTILDTPAFAVQTQLTYQTVQVPKEQVFKGNLILVNNDSLYQFLEESTLVSVFENKNKAYKVSDTTVKVQKRVMDPLNEMMRDFQHATGYQDVMVASGYRSKEHQTRIFNNTALASGTVEAAKWVALPGGSEHHTGYAFDLSIYTDDGLSQEYDGTGDCRWINQHCQDYGFVVRYPENKVDITSIDYEPWHLRYVGKPHAYFMYQQDLCLEEYIEYVRQYTFSGSHMQVVDGDEKTYEIYYVPVTGDNTPVPVPEEKEYTISGNNVDGFIVTVTL